MFSNKDYSYCDDIPKEFIKIKDKKFDEWEIPPWKLYIHSDKLLGEGNFGKVYLATWNHTTVVAKVINESLSEDKKLLFKTEFDILTKTHHPNIVQLLGYVCNPFIIVIEYISNGELLDYIQKKWISNEKKISICLDILKGLTYLHNRQPNFIVHRDIKPQNILITPSGVAKIADFGISRLFQLKERKFSEDDLQNIKEDKELTTFVGSQRYMAPEIKNKQNYNCKIDIWSAGIIFYELFENERYIKSITWRHTPYSLRKIIYHKMLQSDPEKRAHADEIIEDLYFAQANKCLCFY